MDIFNEVCGNLPEGYSITITLENGCADAAIKDPSGNIRDWAIDDMPFIAQIKEAVSWCREDSVSNFTPPRYDAVFRAGC